MFDYQEAFKRNEGFISRSDQSVLKRSCVAIVGLGGTGGSQALALARMGIGEFNIADPDVFELVNFNRQIGATMENLGRKKVEVMREMILAINPEAKVRVFPEGITERNAGIFVLNADAVVDSLDFYCLAERQMLYKQARNLGKWVFTAPPLGFGFSMLAFDWRPAAITFNDYFGFKPEMTKEEMMVRFVCGLSPKSYMTDYLDLKTGSLPSVGAAPFMIAGAMASEVVSLLLDQEANPAPFIYQFDVKLHKFWKGTYNHASVTHKIRRHFLAKLMKGKV